MYAIIMTGGKQYRVAEGDLIDVELLDGDIGSEVDFEALFAYDGSQFHVGGPKVQDFHVMGEIVEFVQGPKVQSIKYIPGNHRKRIGHRQRYMRVKITHLGRKKERKAKHHGS